MFLLEIQPQDSYFIFCVSKGRQEIYPADIYELPCFSETMYYRKINGKCKNVPCGELSLEK
jgi:hypothetical protein